MGKRAEPPFGAAVGRFGVPQLRNAEQVDLRCCIGVGAPFCKVQVKFTAARPGSRYQLTGPGSSAWPV